MGRDGKRIGVQAQPWLQSREFTASLHYMKEGRRREGLELTCDWKGSRTKLGNSATPEMSPQGGAHIHLASSILRGRVNSKVPRFKNIPTHYLIEKYLISLHLTFLICKRNGNISPILGEVGGMRQGLM